MRGRGSVLDVPPSICLRIFIYTRIKGKSEVVDLKTPYTTDTVKENLILIFPKRLEYFTVHFEERGTL